MRYFAISWKFYAPPGKSVLRKRGSVARSIRPDVGSGSLPDGCDSIIGRPFNANQVLGAVRVASGELDQDVE